jgi:acetate kinase
MKILIANIGSTSFRYRLIEQESEAARAVGEVVSVHVIAQPHDDLGAVLPK